MARVRAYIQPFRDNGTYSGEWIEVTDDVPQSKLSGFNQEIEGSDFDIGVLRNSSINLSLMNDRSRYSDVGNAESIFRFSRSNSLVKFTWDQADKPFIAGVSSVGELISHEVELFKGLLNDDNAEMNLSDQQIHFTVTGRERRFDQEIVPAFGSGLTYSEMIFLALNQPGITSVLEVTPGNISPGLDFIPDDPASFVNNTVKEFLEEALFVTNSVLYIEDDAVKVTGRTPSPDVRFNFYGQASEIGADNIISIQSIRNGLHRLFNFITWSETALLARESSSAKRYGHRKKELDFKSVSDTAKRQAILNVIRDEFGSLKQEFVLVTPFTYEALALKMLDRVSIDYPPAAVTSGLDPLYGHAEYGKAEYPKNLSDFMILPADHYKIIGRSVVPLKHQLEFKMRKI